MHIVLDDILDPMSLNYLYQENLNTPFWTLNRRSYLEQKFFGGMVLCDEYQILHNSVIFGYNLAVYHKILNYYNCDEFIKEKPYPKRIHIGAKYKGNIGESHRDSNNIDDTTILFFNNPIWKKEWGGGIMIEDTHIDYVPGRAVIFPSVFNHHVSPIEKDDCPIRLATNFIFQKNIKELHKNANI
tara:strand:+ start:937 stop:1491 length:555 start_codon:yes stop_codon:yes gene_type:complete